jgi:hypothetical protein
MTPEEVRKAVYDRFYANWSSTSYVHYEGHPFTEPAPDIEWARLSVRNTGGGQTSLGAVGDRKYERDFSIFVQVFVPVTGGMKTGATYAQAARAIFEGVRLDPEAYLNDGVITELPIRDGDKSRQFNVEVFGKYLETK